MASKTSVQSKYEWTLYFIFGFVNSKEMVPNFEKQKLCSMLQDETPEKLTSVIEKARFGHPELGLLLQ